MTSENRENDDKSSDTSEYTFELQLEELKNLVAKTESTVQEGIKKLLEAEQHVARLNNFVEDMLERAGSDVQKEVYSRCIKERAQEVFKLYGNETKQNGQE